MICPVCRDEYRKGFTRCATCSVDLVETLDAAAPTTPARSQAPPAPGAQASDGPTVEATLPYCGFLALDEARHARQSLRDRGVRSLIVITESAEGEEFWLRITPEDVKAAVAVLGRHEVAASADESFNCSACGATVGPQDRACPGCGLEFAD
jgi:hypothetical protein